MYGDDIENIAKQKRFVPDKGFEGADASAGRGSGPVQFEKDAEDIFGIDKLLTDAKRVSFYSKKWPKNVRLKWLFVHESTGFLTKKNDQHLIETTF